MTSVSQSTMKKAVEQRRQYLKDNQGSLTMKQFRKLLAEELKVSSKSVKEHKGLITKLVEKILQVSMGDDTEVGAEPEVEELKSPTKSRKRAPTKKPAEKPVKKAKQEAKSGTDGRSGKKEAPRQVKKATKDVKTRIEEDEEATDGPSTKEMAKQVEKMKDVCQVVGIRPGGACISKSSSTRERWSAFVELLGKNELDPNPSQHQIKAAKARLAKEKELEGINLSNVIEGGRRSRTAVNYSAVLKPKYEDISDDSEEEEEEEEDEGDEESGSEDLSQEDSDAENVQPKNGSSEKRASGARKKQAIASDDEAEGEASDEAEDSPDSDAEEASQASEHSSADAEAEDKTPPNSGRKSKTATPRTKKPDLESSPASGAKASVYGKPVEEWSDDD